MSRERSNNTQRSPRTQSAQSDPASEWECFADEIEEPNPELNRITNQIIAAAIRVHRALGPGFGESVYERAMIVELTASGLPFQSQACFRIEYSGQTVGELRLDMVVAGAVVVEFKAVDAIAPIHRAQVLSYLRATGFRLAILINFNVPLLKDGIRRFAL